MKHFTNKDTSQMYALIWFRICRYILYQIYISKYICIFRIKTPNNFTESNINCLTNGDTTIFYSKYINYFTSSTHRVLIEYYPFVYTFVHTPTYFIHDIVSISIETPTPFAFFFTNKRRPLLSFPTNSTMNLRWVHKLTYSFCPYTVKWT